jgi:hypothetical protein
MSILLKSTKWALLALVMFLSLITGCKKELAVETPLPVSEREITLDEVKTRYGNPSKDGTGDRTGAKLPLGVIPKWEGAYMVRTNQFPIILTTVEAPCACPGTDFGGNLGFYKDGFGTIKSVFITWKADPTSPYKAERAPLDSATHFSGMMALVNEQDTIEKVAQILNGRVTVAKMGKVAFPDLASLGVQGNGGVESRDPWDWWRRLWNGIVCPNPNGSSGGMNWDWWNNFWNWLGEAFSNLWDDAGGENFTWPAGSFFFGNVEEGWNINWPTIPDYNQPGGSGIFAQQFAAQMTTCQAIREYIESMGDIPPNYSSTDLEFCQLISELGTDGDENMCLFSQYGTTEIGDLWDYWNSTDKSIESAERIKAFIRARCNGSTSAVLVDMLKQNFCISQHPADLMEDIRSNCGFQSYESPEWDGSFNNGLSDCVKEAIIDDWFDLSGTEKDYLLGNNALFDQVVAFVNSKGCSQDAKNTAAKVIRIQITANLNQTQLNWLFNQTSIVNQSYNFVTNNNLQYQASVKEAVSVHITMLMNDQDYLELNQQAATWPGWIWEIFGEVLVEVGINIVQKQLGLTIGDDVKDAIRSCGSGDMLECLGNTVDVLRRFFPALKFIDLALDLAENTGKATKVWQALNKLQNFGEDFVGKVITLVKNKTGGNLLDSFKWKNANTGVEVFNIGNPQNFWNDFKNMFPDITGPHNNPINPETYKVLGDSIEIQYYVESGTTGGPTIKASIGGYVIKFRLQ